MNKQKREIANNDESVPKKQKVMILEVKFQSNMNRVIKEIADNDNVDCCHSRDSRCREILDTQPEELHEGELININVKSEKRMNLST